jgi:hypothetical protein
VDDISFKDNEGCTLSVDSYQSTTARPGYGDYCFVALINDPDRPSMPVVGLSRAQALALAKFLIEELSK